MSIKRILILALALMVMAMPIGLAEASYGALTVSNIHLDVPGMEAPLDIDASLTIGAGGQGDAGRLDIELVGGGQTAFSGSAGIDKDVVRAIVGGSNYYFEIPMKELQDQLTKAAAMGVTGGITPEHLTKIMDLATRYIAVLEKYSDPAASKVFGEKVLAAYNIVEKGKESTELFGQAMELNRYDAAITGQDMGKIYKALFDADPEIKALMEDYFALINELSGGEMTLDGVVEGEKIPFTVDSLTDAFPAMLEAAGIEMKLDLSVWTDSESMAAEDAKAVKEVMTITITAPKGATSSDPSATPAPDAVPEMETVSFPVTVSILESDEGVRTAFSMDVTPPETGNSASMSFDGTFDAPDGSGGTASKGTFTMNVTSELDPSENVDLAMDFDSTTGADGVTDSSFAFGGVSAGETVEFGIAYDGLTATEDEKTGTVAIAFNAPDVGKGELSFDVKVAASAFKPLGDQDFEGKTKVNPLSEDPADQKLMEEASTELNGVMMQAMGVLMQTPGLSNIMGSAMNSGMIE